MASTYISLPAVSIAGPVDVIVDAAQDSIKISDGTDILAVNPDGSINTVTTISSGFALQNTYGEATSVPSSTPTTVVSVVAAAGNKLRRVEAAGTNIARFEVKINGFVVAKKYTYFGGPFWVDFDFPDGLALNAADSVTVVATHSQTDVGDFNSNIMLYV